MDIYIRLYDIIIILQSYATCALKELITVIVASFYTGAMNRSTLTVRRSTVQPEDSLINFSWCFIEKVTGPKPTH